MANNYYITGTDTDAGKTLITQGLLHQANAQGLRTLGLKPLAAGATLTTDGLRNDDALLLQQAASVKLPYAQINPVILEPAIAPHIAASLAGRHLRINQLAGFVRGALLTPADLRLVEGAGGWLTPVNAREGLNDLVKELQLPVIWWWALSSAASIMRC